MTDEKKKPAADEVSDEQLEDVAGGFFVASQKSAGTSFGFPDVCKTPVAPTPIPIPYPSTGGSDDSGTKVKVDGGIIGTKSDTTAG